MSWCRPAKQLGKRPVLGEPAILQRLQDWPPLELAMGTSHEVLPRGATPDHADYNAQPTEPLQAADQPTPARDHKRSKSKKQASRPDRFEPSDFGVEIGGRPSFENLPRIGERFERKLCVGCRRRRALFRYHGAVRFDRDHKLCFRCYRSAMDRLVATLL